MRGGAAGVVDEVRVKMQQQTVSHSVHVLKAVAEKKREQQRRDEKEIDCVFAEGGGRQDCVSCKHGCRSGC